jgi:hypothetical protein
MSADLERLFSSCVLAVEDRQSRMGPVIARIEVSKVVAKDQGIQYIGVTGGE